jgi:ankyrin repeat protein
LDDRVDRDNVKDFPLARYAAQYWATHARFENASSCIKDGVECLFDADKPHFSAWLWVYDEDWNRSMASMCPEKPRAVPLYYAARLGFRNLAEHLIGEHPEDVNARGGAEKTPMHVAAREGHTDILLLLLEHGAAVDGRGINGQSPLHRASWNERLEAGLCLLDHGADINARGDDGITPLSAALYGGAEFTRMLLERGAWVNTHGPYGWTPLHLAVVKTNVQAVRLLLEHGADANARDESGSTPSQKDSARINHEIARLLSEYGAESAN